MKSLFCIVLFFCAWVPVNDNGCKKKNDIIVWREGIKLKWEDFESDSFPGVNISALSALKISFNYKVRTNLDWVKVQSEFSRSRSIARKDVTPHLLLHEQGHFDLAEIYAREIRRDILKIHTKVNRSNHMMLDSIHHFWDSKKTKEQIMYDKETDYSIDTLQQSKWNNDIKQRLMKLDAYKDLYYRF